MTGCVAFAEERLHGVLDQREFQQHRLVLEEVEFLPRDRRPGLEVHEVERFGQGDVVLRWEVEFRRLSRLGDDLVVSRFLTHRRVGVGHVRDGQQLGVQLVLDRLELLL